MDSTGATHGRQFQVMATSAFIQAVIDVIEAGVYERKVYIDQLPATCIQWNIKWEVLDELAESTLHTYVSVGGLQLIVFAGRDRVANILRELPPPPPEAPRIAG